jgi:hypothetical protein
VYHINAVDEVTQWQVIGSVAAITQAHLEPVLRAILGQFPFRIRDFHSDNGSKFINDSVSGLLKRLLIEQTKSRPRNSNDNALVEFKNGAVIRKHIGYGYIAATHAEDIHRFYTHYFNAYLSFHRPCGQPERIVDERGKENFSVETLDRIANGRSDTESAMSMQEAKRKLYRLFHVGAPSRSPSANSVTGSTRMAAIEFPLTLFVRMEPGLTQAVRSSIGCGSLQHAASPF